jgi:glutamate-5-semialdehyde dehydrogenase
MGVIGMIYESRPNVTADAAGLCLKAGSAVVLRGGSDAANSNKVIVAVLRQAVKSGGITPEIIQLIESPSRELVSEILTCTKYLDLLIPRGGAALIQRVVEEATVSISIRTPT